MITDRKAWGGLVLLCRLGGSPAARAILAASQSALLALALALLTRLDEKGLLVEHPVPDLLLRGGLPAGVPGAGGGCA